MAFDPECHKLAKHFLPTNARPGLVDKLAQHLQDSVETFLASSLEEARSALLCEYNKNRNRLI